MSAPSPAGPPDALLCDACRPRLRRAVWSLRGVDRHGRAYRAVTCDGCVDELTALADERGGVGELLPLPQGAPA